MKLSVRDLAGGYERCDVFSGVSFDLADGESALIVGPNGAGKSTLLKCLFGLIPPSRGEVLLDGVDITRQPTWRRVRPRVGRSMGLVLQGRRIFGTLSVEENLIAAASVIRSRVHRRARVAAVMESFPHLAKLRGKVARLLSGGEQQALVIARTLLADPSVLLMDEPTLGLDEAGRESIWSIVRSLKGRGLTLVLVEHDISRALAACDRCFRFAPDQPFEERGREDVATVPELSGVGRSNIEASGYSRSQ
jgi:branched-chain amino acid transport system ATP-binding protein